MNRRAFATLLALSICAAPTIAHAQTESVSEASAIQINTGYLSDQTFAILPELGAFAFKDAQNNTAARGAAGIAFDFNLAHLDPASPRSLYVGISTGALYSHVGGPNANFFGGGSNPSTPNGANVVIIPANIQVGFNVSDHFRISAHGGANAIYNSQPGSVQLGSSNLWNVFPNIGGDLDFAIAKNIAMGVRPDYTFTSVSDFFTGTVEFGYFFD